MKLRHVFVEGYKAGYKKALNEAAGQQSELYEEIVSSFADATRDAMKYGERELIGILDHWQQLYGDDYLYDDSINVTMLAKACLQGVKAGGLKNPRMNTSTIAAILRQWKEEMDNFF